MDLHLYHLLRMLIFLIITNFEIQLMIFYDILVVQHTSEIISVHCQFSLPQAGGHQHAQSQDHPEH